MKRWLLWLPPLLALGCGGSAVPPTGPCSVASRAEIGAAYETEMAADCHGGVCPHEAEITARYEARRQEWTECQSSKP